MAESGRPRVLLLADTSREAIHEVVEALRPVIAAHADIVGELDANGDPLPAGIEADVALAVGGDGTLISQLRRLLESGLPLIGINVGRLGFLAEFDVSDLADHAEIVFGPSPPIREHMLLAAEVRDKTGAIIHEDLAINDCVISNGEPFRMIELNISVDGMPGPVLTGDGVIVATPVGSTAYNVSAGGPIVHRRMEGIIITPLAAHSLAFRPIVINPWSEIRIVLSRTIPGTTLVSDGRVGQKLEQGQVVTIRRHERRARMVDNPATSYWQILLDKMRWAAPPTYRDRGG
jgi:NAD+ kinase